MIGLYRVLLLWTLFPPFSFSHSNFPRGTFPAGKNFDNTFTLLENFQHNNNFDLQNHPFRNKFATFWSCWEIHILLWTQNSFQTSTYLSESTCQRSIFQQKIQSINLLQKVQNSKKQILSKRHNSDLFRIKISKRKMAFSGIFSD